MDMCLLLSEHSWHSKKILDSSKYKKNVTLYIQLTQEDMESIKM